MIRLTFRQLAATAALLAVLPMQAMQAMQAQQVAAPDKAANAAAGAAPASPASTATRTSVPGAPILEFHGPTAVTRSATASPAKLVDRSAALLGPRVDPITGAPLSTFGQRAPVATEVSSEQKAMLASDGPVHQGLTVHGHWVINVSDPDGTLVQHREFENSLSSTGQGFLVGLLSGYMVPGDWMIALGPLTGNGACVATYQYCGIAHSTATYPGLGYCDSSYYCTGSTLSYAYNFGSGFNGPYSIVLSGSITANQTGSIGTVTTISSLCSNGGYSTTVNPNAIETSSPTTCVTQTTPQPWYGPFTGTNLATPIAVTDGQLVQVIVTITFS